jgi:putative ubiquitin-RnfH superfamily antitoxin RatB of RatAB toxin-antitoxin module
VRNLVSKRCRVLCDTERGVLSCELELSDGATIAEALAAARAQLGGVADWEGAPTGIFGEPRRRDYVPADGDRIELYRALQIDPRARRRARVVAQGRVKRGLTPPGD